MKALAIVGALLLAALLALAFLLDNTPRHNEGQPQHQQGNAPPPVGSRDEEALRNLRIN